MPTIYLDAAVFEHVPGKHIWITVDGSAGRKTRAARINAEKRVYERTHNVQLTLTDKSYDETPGFLHRSRFYYKVEVKP